MGSRGRTTTLGRGSGRLRANDACWRPSKRASSRSEITLHVTTDREMKATRMTDCMAELS